MIRIVDIYFYSSGLDNCLLLWLSNIAHRKYVFHINNEGRSDMNRKLFIYFGRKKVIDNVGM